MAIKKTNLRSLLFAVMIGLWLPIGVPSLWAQAGAPDSGAYFPETRYIQRLTWAGDSNALRYEVVVEKEDGREFQRVLQQFTDAAFVEVSLPPAKYRYRVIPYDAFNRPAKESAWMSFEIRAAIKPELTNFSPDFFLYDKKTDFTLNITGKNLLRGAEIYLRQLGTTNAPIVPTRTDIEQDGNRARLRFNYNQFAPGFYVIFVKNPGGQETSKGEVAVGYPEALAPELHATEQTPRRGATPPPAPAAAPATNAAGDSDGSEGALPISSGNNLFDVHMGALWLPMIHMYGGIDQIFGSALYLSSAAIRFGAFLNKPAWLFQPGLELMVSWYSLKEMVNDYDAEVQLIAGTFYLAAQTWFANDSAALTFRAGLGMGYQTGVYNHYAVGRSDVISMNGKAPHGDIGVAFLIVLQKHFTLEFGLYYTHLLVKENASGYMRPSIGFGWQF